MLKKYLEEAKKVAKQKCEICDKEADKLIDHDRGGMVCKDCDEENAFCKACGELLDDDNDHEGYCNGCY